MRRLAVLLLLFAAPVLSQSNPLRQAAGEGATSIAWTIRTTGVSMCGCGRGWTNDGDASLEHRDVVVVAQLEGNRIARLQLLAPECPLEARLLSATADQSLDFLFEHLRDTSGDGKLLAAVSMHDHPRVVPELVRIARTDPSPGIRRNAIFWLGQKAGVKAAGELRRAVDEDPDDDVRKHAVFAISQLPPDRSVPLLLDLAKTHKRPAVRKRAMFWLAQSGDPRALELFEEILIP